MATIMVFLIVFLIFNLKRQTIFIEDSNDDDYEVVMEVQSKSGGLSQSQVEKVVFRISVLD
jgi:hypothetical protein